MAAGFVKTFSRRFDFLGQFFGVHFLHCFFSKSNIISLKFSICYMKWYEIMLNSLGNYSMKICKTILYRFCNSDCPTTCMETSHDSSGRIIYLHDTFRVPYIYNFMMILIIYEWLIFSQYPTFLGNNTIWLPNLTIFRNIIDGDGRATGTSLDVT